MPEVTNTNVALLAEIQKMLTPMQTRLDTLEKENQGLKSELEVARNSENIPTDTTPPVGGMGHWGSRAAVSVVLPTRPVVESPNDPSWKGRVAGVSGVAKDQS